MSVFSDFMISNSAAAADKICKLEEEIRMMRLEIVRLNGIIKQQDEERLKLAKSC